MESDFSQNLFAFLFADEERVFAEYDVGCTLQLVTSIRRYIELDDVIDHQGVLTDRVTITERNLNRPEHCTVQFSSISSTVLRGSQ